MRKLTQKEEVIMNRFWEHGDLFVRELRELYPDPKPHFNTRQQYMDSSFSSVVDKFFGSSYLSAVSALVKDEKITIEELKELIREIENQ